jgi:hypothetical protein
MISYRSSCLRSPPLAEILGHPFLLPLTSSSRPLTSTTVLSETPAVVLISLSTVFFFRLWIARLSSLLHSRWCQFCVYFHFEIFLGNYFQYATVVTYFFFMDLFSPLGQDDCLQISDTKQMTTKIRFFPQV